MAVISVLAAILLLAIGCWTAWKMEVDVFPDLNAPTVVVMTEAQGMAAEEVERVRIRMGEEENPLADFFA